LKLWRNLHSLLPAPAHFRLIGNNRASSYIDRVRSQILERIEPALLNGRIDELQRMLDFAESDPEMRTPIRSALRKSGIRRLLELPTGVSEWLAAKIQDGREQAKDVPKPSDESQSAAVESVAACLLSAWDGVAYPARAVDALKAVEALAHDLFKIDLVGQVGEVVNFDARQHEGVGGDTDLEFGKVVRPGVAWSDGLRSRIVIRALVERTSERGDP